MKNLLAIVRDPDHADSYVNYLKGMGENIPADVHLCYIENPADYTFGAPDSTGVATANLELSLGDRTRKAEQKLARLVEEFDVRPKGGGAIQYSTEIGDTLEIVNEFASGRNDSMIVLKNEGNSSLWERSDYDMKVLRDANCPVWIIPDETVFRSFDEIVYATDFNKEDLPTLRKLIALTGRFTPNITALHVNTDDAFMARVKQAGFQDMVRKKTACDRITVKVLEKKETDDLGLLVNDFATLIDAKLIVVLKENKHFLERIFNPDTSRKIIRQASIPVLVYHEPQ
jgi:nucleotide-binding universal stress UspA family protein